MAMMHQPRTPGPPSSPAKKSWLPTEWNHLDQMPLSTMSLLFVPTVLLGLLNPLLPIAAYAMQRWAGSSWTWRDRWASIQAWAKQGTVLVAILVLLAWLAAVHFLFFPALVAGVQNAWYTAHLPGILSLSPLDGHALGARSLLSLPLAPALSLYYERIDPRTQLHPQRVLTPADLAALTHPQPVAPPASTHTTTQDQATPPPKAKRRKTSSTKTKKQPPTTTTSTEQMTVESVLVPDQAHKPTPSASRRGTKTRTDAHHTSTGTITTHTTDQKPPDDDDIDWDDVAE